MFDIFNLKGMAIAAGVSLAVGFGSGVWVRGAFCDAAAAKQEVANLKKLLTAATAASENDAKAVAENAGKVEELEKAIRDAMEKVARSDGQCLDGAAADGVRGLWQ